MLVNLYEEEYRDQVLIYNNKTLDGLEKIKDSLKDGAVVTVQKEKGNSKLFATKNTIGTQTKPHDKQDTLKTTKQHREEQSIEL